MQTTWPVAAFYEKKPWESSALSRPVHFTQLKDTVHFASLKGVRGVKLSYQQAKPADAESIEELHTMLLVSINPNKLYGVPMGWTMKRVRALRTIGVQQVQERIQRSLAYPERHFWQVSRNKYNDIVGFIEVFRQKDKPSQVILYGLYVHSDYQGSPAGKQLFEESTKWARSHGYQTMALVVAPYNPAIAFYRSIGFTIVPDSLKMFDNVMPLITMILDLNQPPPEADWEIPNAKETLWQKALQKFQTRSDSEEPQPEYAQ